LTDYILYGSQASLFTGKARAYMQWKGVDFEERPVTETVMKTVILPNVGWAVIPVIDRVAALSGLRRSMADLTGHALSLEL